MSYEQLSRTTEQIAQKKTRKLRKCKSPFQTINRVAIPATTLPTNTPTPIAAVITAEPLSAPVEPPPLGAGVGFGGEEPPPDPPPWTKNGFMDSLRDVVIVTPPCSRSPMQFATPELSAHDILISSLGREACKTASEGPWTIIAVRKEKRALKSATLS